MQYSFEFNEKTETSELPELSLNHLDYKELSGYAEFAEKLANFNERYDMDLVATKSSRWQPGTYDKIKASVDNILYPHWKKRRGANSIHKLLERNQWNYNNFSDNLEKLDSMLYSYRKEGIELFNDDDLDKSKELLNEVLQKFLEEYNNVEVSISPVPYFGRRLRGYHNSDYAGTYGGCVPRLYPIINQDNKVIGSYNREMYNDLDDYYQQLTTSSKEPNPRRWFVNISVLLKDVVINLTNSNMNVEYAKLPYGDIVVTFTIDFVTLLTNYRRITKKQHTVKTEFIGTVAQGYPLYQGTQHPFIYRGRSTTNPLNYYNSYSNGNICLGELTNDIFNALLSGNIELLKSHLYIWANSFSAGTTSPLNGLNQLSFGVREEWDDITRALISGSNETCTKYIKSCDNHESKIAFTEKFCAGCAVKDKCKIYEKLNLDKVSWMDEVDENWIQAYNKLCIHLSNEVDAKQVYEIFADLYYFYKSKKLTIVNLMRTFNSNTSRVDYTDCYEYLDSFIMSGPTGDNIIKIFEVCERNFALGKIYNDNGAMFDELASKTKGLNYNQAIKILTTRDIENTHYSWLFANGYIGERSEYWTYINMLKGRKEGIRYDS